MLIFENLNYFGYISIASTAIMVLSFIIMCFISISYIITTKEDLIDKVVLFKP